RTGRSQTIKERCPNPFIPGMLVDEDCEHAAILQNARALREAMLSFDHLEPGPAPRLTDMLVNKSVRHRPVNNSMSAGPHKFRAEDEQLPIPDVIDRPKNALCSVNSLQSAFEVGRIKIILHFLPGLFHERECAQQVRHEIHEMSSRATIHFFRRPIRARDFDIPPREPAIPAEQKMPKPANHLPKAEHPGNRPTPKKPGRTPVDEVHAVIKSIRWPQPKVAHSNFELTLSVRHLGRQREAQRKAEVKRQKAEVKISSNSSWGINRTSSSFSSSSSSAEHDIARHTQGAPTRAAAGFT